MKKNPSGDDSEETRRIGPKSLFYAFKSFILGSDLKSASKEKHTNEISKDSKQKTSKNHISNFEDHAFPMVENVLNSDRFKSLGKEKIVMGIGAFLGFLLIILSIVFLVSGSPIDPVADNVIFSEKAVFSVFLMLIGILIIAGVFAQKMADKTIFKGISHRVRNIEDVQSTSKSSNAEKKNRKKNNSKIR